MRPSNTVIYICMAISIVLGTIIYITANALGLTLWVHIISIFLSLAIIEFMKNVCFPIDPKSKCLEKADLNSAIILFIVVFGAVATIFTFMTSLLSIRRRTSKNASS